MSERKPVILNGATDTRGMVTGEEAERLAATFGKTLHDARTTCGLSTEELGNLAGVSPRHLRYLEAGQRRPSVDAIKALARVLVPSTHRERLETILANAAGDSLREGNQRKKRRAEHAERKQAARGLLERRRQAQRLIKQYQDMGQEPPELLRLLVNSPAMQSALEVSKAPPEPTIKNSEVADRFERARDPKEYMRQKIAEIKRTT